MKFKLHIDPNKDEEVVATVHAPSALSEQLEALVMAHGKTDRITAYTEDDLRVLKFAEIECITVIDGKTIAIETKGKHYRLKQRLYELESILPATFLRINKSSFANETRIKEFTTAFSGAVDVIFRCGYREYVSRRCFAQIKRRYEKL